MCKILCDYVDNMESEQLKIINHTITRLLSRREHSQAELLQKLSAKGLSEPLCLQQIKKFTDKGIQSDQRYAESLVRSAYAKGKGPVFVRQTLNAQNINIGWAQDLIKSHEYDWYQLAIDVRQKRFGQDVPTDFAAQQKQKRFLQYRGFEAEQIQNVFD